MTLSCEYFTSIGILKSSRLDDGYCKVIIEVDQEILNYYLSGIPKWIKVNRPRYPAHISVVRNEQIFNLEYFEEINDLKIVFQYGNIIYNDETYFWLEVICPELCKIREKLGLSKVKPGVTFSPDFRHLFHLTIGNRKNL